MNSCLSSASLILSWLVSLVDKLFFRDKRSRLFIDWSPHLFLPFTYFQKQLFQHDNTKKKKSLSPPLPHQMWPHLWIFLSHFWNKVIMNSSHQLGETKQNPQPGARLCFSNFYTVRKGVPDSHSQSHNTFLTELYLLLAKCLGNHNP